MIEQKLLLADKFFPDVIEKRKLGTIRKSKRDINPGWLLLEATDKTCGSINVYVTHVTYTSMEYVTDEDAKLDGFNNVDELMNVLKEFYPDISWYDIVTIVRFVYKDN